MPDKTYIQSQLADSVVLPPQGRITLTSNTPVLTTDTTGATTIYYTPYIGNAIPIYNGTTTVTTTFTQVSLALDATNFLATNLYDIFVYNDSGTIRVGYGPAWTNSTTRSAAISMLNGIWTNTSTITLRYSSSNTTSVAANQATYVGTTYATANGQTGMQFKPTPSPGGTQNFLGLYNSYNRVMVSSLETDSTVSWTYGTSTWRQSDGNNNNRVSFVDGLQQSQIFASFSDYVSTASSSTTQLGMNLDSTSATPNYFLQVSNASIITNVPLTVTESFKPQIGFHFIQGMENAPSSISETFFGSPYYALIVKLEM